MVTVGVWIPCYRRWVGRAAVRSLATRAEELGFGSLWVQDHLVAPVGDADEAPVELLSSWMSPNEYGNDEFSATEYFGEENWWLDPYAVWGFLAGVTERIELGSAIIVLPYRHPVVQAKLLGTLDVLSDGRMLFGVGVGHVPSEFEALGVPYARRGARTDDYLRAIDALLAGGREASHRGEFVDFGTVRPLIEPASRPRPPVLIGGAGKRSVRRTVELGDGWLPAHVEPEGLAMGINYLREQATAAGRSMPSVNVSLVWGLLEDGEAPPRSRRTFRSVEQTGALIQQYAALGVDRLAIDVPNPDLEVTLRQYELLAKAVDAAGTA